MFAVENKNISVNTYSFVCIVDYISSFMQIHSLMIAETAPRDQLGCGFHRNQSNTENHKLGKLEIALQKPNISVKFFVVDSSFGKY